MKTDSAFSRFLGPLQRHVCIILTLPIFFTAFTFFVDVFTLHITSCSDNIASKSSNQTLDSLDTNIFNISTSWTGNHSDPIRVSNKDCTTYSLFRAQHMYSVCYRLSVLQQSLTCHEAKRFAHGQLTYMTGLLIGSLFGGAVSDKLVFAPFCFRRQTSLRTS